MSEKPANSSTPSPIPDYWAEEDEIDLAELFAVLYRKKGLILAIVLVSLILAAILVFVVMTPKYEVGMIIRSGVTGFNAKGQPISGWKTEDLKTWIETGAYAEVLRPKYGGSLPKVKASTIRRGSLVSLKMYYPDPKVGRQMLSDILGLFLEGGTAKKGPSKIASEKALLKRQIEEQKRRLALVDVEKERFNDQIQYKKSKIQTVKKEIDLIEKDVQALEAAKKKLTKEINSLNKNTEELIKLKNALIGSKSADKLTLLMYSNIIQENIAYVSNLEQRLLDITKEINSNQSSADKERLEIERIKNEIKKLKLTRDKNLEKKKFDIQNQIKALETKLGLLAPVEIVQPPYSSAKPVKPKKTLIMAITLATSLFFAVFMAFFVEFLAKSKEKIVAKQTS